MTRVGARSNALSQSYLKEMQRGVVLVLGEGKKAKERLVLLEESLHQAERFGSWRNTKATTAHVHDVQDLEASLHQLYFQTRDSLPMLLDC